MRSRPPLLSVVIPAFNSEVFLGTAIRSVLDQGNGEIELVVVNDGSTDATAQVAAQFGDRIRYFEQLNGGVSRARNAGLRLATGRWVACLDADDFWLPAYWKHIGPMLSAEAEYDVLCFGWVYAGQDGGIVGVAYQPPEGIIELREIVAFNRILSHSAVVRKNLLERIGGFDPFLGYAEDWDVWIRLALAGAQFRRIPTPLVAYRQRFNSQSKNLCRAREHGLHVIEKAFGQPGFPDDLQDERDRVRGRFLIQMAAGEFAAGDEGSAFADLHEACCSAPSLLSEEQTYSSIASLGQPVHDWGTGLGIELRQRHCFMTALFDRLHSELGCSREEQLRGRATMYRVFLKLAYQQHSRLAMVRYWTGLLSARQAELARRENWRWLPRIVRGRPRSLPNRAWNAAANRDGSISVPTSGGVP